MYHLIDIHSCVIDCLITFPLVTECDIDRDSKILALSVMEINMLIWVLFQDLLSSASLYLPLVFPSPNSSSSCLSFRVPQFNLFCTTPVCKHLFFHKPFCHSLHFTISYLFIPCTVFTNKISCSCCTTAPS